MARIEVAARWNVAIGAALAVLLLGWQAASAQTASLPVPASANVSANASTGASAAASTAARGPSWIAVSRVAGRLRAADIGLVINSADPASVQVGEHYIAARKLLPQQVLRIAVPQRPVLTRDEFERLRRVIESHFGPATQALAMAWNEPYAVECNSITGALALGFDAELCKHSCAASRVSLYFNSPSVRPLADHGLRPSMLLAARSVEQAKALIDRGVAADGALALRGRPPVSAMFLTTEDAPRRVRSVLYPPPGPVASFGLDVQVVAAEDLPRAKRVLMVSTGSVRAPLEPTPDWAPGALGDHLTSYAGDLLGSHGQGTALDWIESGTVASHGPVSEPCNHLQKFPHPQVLLLHYLQGSTVMEAYWKSVAWPQQSLFIGEPLAAPFSRR